MNKELIENVKNYVNILLSPLQYLYYHQYDHALDVMERAVELWKKEWLDDEQLEILALAWLFHDTWFVIQYDNNEPIWAKIAKNYLRWMLYPEEKIAIIERLILATDPNYTTPKDILEKIIKDADLDNLWRDDFMDKFNNIQKELEYIKKIKTKDPNWIHWTISFLEKQKFSTQTQENERNEKKEKNINILKEMLKDLEDENK